MNGSPTVLEWTAYFTPGYKGGGPTKSVTALIAHLPEWRLRVVTGDRDLGEPGPYPGIQPDRWRPTGTAQVWYRSRGALGRLRMLFSVRRVDPDLHHMNSVWSPGFSLLPMVALAVGFLHRRPVLLSPRGEFAPFSLTMSARRKRVVGVLLRRLVLPRLDLTWHATSEHEVAQIHRWAGPGARVAVVQNLTSGARAAGGGSWTARPQGTPLRAVFLSRIARNKNVGTAIEAVLALDGAVTLDVIGPLEDTGYGAECRALAADHKDLVRFLPPVLPDDVSRTLQRYDVMVFPTFNENFGHAIAEALAVGTPVVTSDATPWTPLLLQAGLTVSEPTDTPGHAAQLCRLAGLDDVELTMLRRRIRAALDVWAGELTQTAEQYRKLFDDLTISGKVS